MQRIDNLEAFLAEFLGWYEPFLNSLRQFDLREHSIGKPPPDYWKFFSEKDLTFKEVHNKGEDQYEIASCERKAAKKGTHPELVFKEEELESKISELIRKYGVSAKPVFNFLNQKSCIWSEEEQSDVDVATSPHYNLFLKGIEFNTTPLKIFVGLMAYNDIFFDLNDVEGHIEILFSAQASVPVSREDVSSGYVRWIHPDKTKKAYFIIDPFRGGKFYYKNDNPNDPAPLKKHLKFEACEDPMNRDQYLFTAPLFVQTGILGKGALETFLDMVSLK